MPAPYSCPVLTYTMKTDKVDLVSAAHINALQTEQIAQNNRLLNTIDSDGSLLSGASYPSPALPSQMFYRTDIDTAYIRNAANTSWQLLTAASNIQVFTSNGTFTAPSGITKVYLSMTGGGGGGGGGALATNGGGGGGSGASVLSYPFTVTPGNNYSVTIGGGGGGGAADTTGSAGSSTTFDTLTVAGGNPGGGGSGGGAGGTGGGTASTGASTGPGVGFTGGTRVGTAAGTGASSHFGKGGDGGSGSPGGNGGTNSGAGGGGGGHLSQIGGNGGSGICVVAY